MPLFLAQRDTESRERMDDPNCELDELQNTYHQFGRVNHWISRWRTIYKQKIRPHLHQRTKNTLLDIGFGGGDIPIKLAEWALADGLALQITAIDPDPRAMEFVETLNYPQNIQFMQCNLSELNPADEQFNFVISNHLIHHLAKTELLQTLSHAKKLSTTTVIFNDLRRNDIAYLFFNIVSRPLFRSSFITEDGLTSIKRSYTKKELTETVPNNWKVQNLSPYRLLLTFDHE